MNRRHGALALTVIIAIAVGGASCTGCPWTTGPPPPTVIKLQIRTHPTTGLTPAEADQSRLGATKVIAEGGATTADVSCGVELSIESLGTLEAGTGSVNSFDDWVALFQEQADPGVRKVRIVNDISWCENTFKPEFVGCSDQPGVRIALEREPLESEVVLWAHEIGHTQALPHSLRVRNVMYSDLNGDHLELTSFQCGFYQQ